MKKITRNIATLMVLTLAGTVAKAQVVEQKVGDNNLIMNQNAVLEIESSNRGLLLPRLALKATDAFAPLTAHVEGMTVYNTVTAGTGVTAVTPGYYYNDGTQWVRVATGADAKTEPWFVQNTSDEATANTDNIYQQGKVAIGFTDADGVSDKQLEVKGDAKIANENAGKFLAFETNTLGDVASFPGFAQSRLYAGDDEVPANATKYSTISNFVEGNYLKTFSNEGGVTKQSYLLATEDAFRTAVIRDASQSHFTMDPNVVPTSMSTSRGLRFYDYESSISSLIGVAAGERGVFFEFKTISSTDSYKFPKNVGNVNQVLTVSSITTEGGSNNKYSTLEWKNVSDLIKSAMPKFFYMPSVEIPTHDISTGNLLTGLQTINLYDSYTEQFGFTGGANQARSNTSSTLPVLPADELDYFITYFDDDVFENVNVTSAGVLTYQVKSTAIVTPKTFMNIVFKVRD